MKTHHRTVPITLSSHASCLLFLASFKCWFTAGQIILSTFSNNYLVPTPTDHPLCALSNDSQAFNCISNNPVHLLEKPCSSLVASFSTLISFVVNGTNPHPRTRAFAISSHKKRSERESISPFPDPNFQIEFDINPESISVSIQCHFQNLLPGSVRPFLNSSQGGPSVEWIVWVEYEGLTRVLNITVADASQIFATSKPKRPMVSVEFDLAQCFEVRNMFFGISLDAPELQTGREGLDNLIAQSLWTLNSNGPAPDLPRDIYGAPMLYPVVTKTSRIEAKLMIFGFGVPGGLAFVGLTYVIYIMYRRNSRLNALAKKYDVRGIDEIRRGPRKFTYKNLSAATKGFSSNRFIGKGGFGSVYKGKLHLCGSQYQINVAVKRISTTSGQGAREFLNEVKIVGQVGHRNLVPLIGWCHEKGELLLVYEYMPNGSLDSHLFSLESSTYANPVLTWPRRLKILSGVSTALAYLHEDWEKRILHRDIKSSNVMLDSDFNGRLGDFGLAKLSDHNQGPLSTQILAGTYGYLAPELGQTLKATEKTDVYSFGALVLEVATGRTPVFTMNEKREPEDHVFLVDWVWNLYGNGDILHAADIRLKNAYDCAEMVTLLKIGLLCCHPDPGKRPTMREVRNIWRGAIAFPDLPHAKPVPVFMATFKSNSVDVDNELRIDVEDGSLGKIFAGDDPEAFKTSVSTGWSSSRSRWRSTPLPI